MPPCPDALAHLYVAFVDLVGTRSRGFATGPISFREIDAYDRRMQTGFSAWDARLIRRLDTATQAVAAGVSTSKPQTDVGGLKAMLRGIVAAKAQAAKASKPQGDQNA